MESAPYDDLGYATLTLDTPEELEALTGLHQSIVTHKEELEEVGWESTWSEDGSGLSIQSDGWTYVDISYTLMDGSYLTRKYRVPLSQSELDTPAPPPPGWTPCSTPPAWLVNLTSTRSRRETGWWTPGSPTPIRTVRLSPPPP